MAEEEGVLTGIDAFVRYLSEHGETEASVVAAEVGVGERNIEEWAKILERSKKAKISYKLGKMFISLTSGSDVLSVEEMQMGEVKKEILDGEVGAQLDELEKLADRVTRLNKLADESENILKNNSGDIRSVISRVSKLRSETERDFNVIKAKKKEVENFLEEIKALSDVASSSVPVPGAAESKGRTILEDIRSKIKVFEDSNTQLVSNFDREVKTQRERLFEFTRDLRREIQVFKSTLDEEEKRLNEYEKAFAAYNSNSEMLKKQIEHRRSGLIDEAEKVRIDSTRIYEASEKELERLNPILSKAEAGFTGFNELDSEFKTIKDGVARVSGDTGRLKTELELLREQIKSLDSMPKEKSMEKAGVLKRSSDMAKGTSRRISKARKDIGDMEEKASRFTK